MIFEVGSCRVDLDSSRDRIAEVESTDYEHESLSAWAEAVAPGAWAVDVGGYSGLYGIGAALLGARVVIVEPMPWQQNRIVENARRNNVDIELVCAAASDVTGPAEILFAYPDNTSMASLDPHDRVSNAKTSRKMKVSTVLLDNIIMDGRISVMKLDVERHEIAVLRGARRIIQEHSPTLIVEALFSEVVERLRDVIPVARYHDGVWLDNRRNLLFRPRRSS